MNKKQLFLKLLILVVGGVAVFLLSSCLTSIRILSCKKSCIESCNSCNSYEEDISGEEYGVYYTLNNSGDYYMVSEVGYKETEVVIPETYAGYPVMGIKRGALSHYHYGGACGGGYYVGVHLTSLTLPKTMRFIEFDVFADDSNNYDYRGGGTCNTLIFEGTVEDWLEIEIGSSPFTSTTKFYVDNKELTELVVPESVTEIKENSFANYTGLKNLTLHEKVTKIGENAFTGCDCLYEVTFPCTELTIDSNAFSACKGLNKIAFTGEKVVLGYSAFEDCILLEEVEWNTVNVPEISARAFRDCLGLQSFVVPATVEHIDNQAFYGCVNLDQVYNLSKLNITAGSDNHGYVAYYAGIVHTEEEDNSSILTEGDYKFVVSEEKTELFKYTGLGGVLNLPDMDGGYRIREKAFFDNDSITAVYIPKGVTAIGGSAFASCDELQLVTGCVGIKNVGVGAFSNCDRLERIELANVETIGAQAFANCKAIKSIELPKTLTSVGMGAFRNCTAEITYDGTLEEWGKVILGGDTFNPDVTVICSDGEWTGKI